MASSFQDDYIKTAFRLPRELHARVMDAATSSGKSLNAELIERIEKSFQPPPDTAAALSDLRVHLELQNDLIWGFIQQAVAMLEGGTKAQAKAMLEHVNKLITKRQKLTDQKEFDEAIRPLVAAQASSRSAAAGEAVEVDDAPPNTQTALQIVKAIAAHKAGLLENHTDDPRALEVADSILNKLSAALAGGAKPEVAQGPSTAAKKAHRSSGRKTRPSK